MMYGDPRRGQQQNRKLGTRQCRSNAPSGSIKVGEPPDQPRDLSDSQEGLHPMELVITGPDCTVSQFRLFRPFARLADIITGDNLRLMRRTKLLLISEAKRKFTYWWIKRWIIATIPSLRWQTKSYRPTDRFRERPGYFTLHEERQNKKESFKNLNAFWSSIVKNFQSLQYLALVSLPIQKFSWPLLWVVEPPVAGCSY